MTTQPEAPRLATALTGVLSIAATTITLISMWTWYGASLMSPSPNQLLDLAWVAGALLGWGWLGYSCRPRSTMGRRDLAIVWTTGALGALLTFCFMPAHNQWLYLLAQSAVFTGLWTFNGLGALWIWKTIRRIRKASNREDS